MATSRAGVRGNEQLTADQLTIQQLQQVLADVVRVDPQYGDPWFLLPWLKINRFNVAKAEVGVRQSIKWRQETNFDDLAEQDIDPELQSQFPVFLDGVTKDGIPVLTMSVGGEVDHRGIVAKYGRDRYFRFFLQVLSKAEKIGFEARRKLNPTLKSSTVCGIQIIGDVTDYRFNQARCMVVIQTWLEISQGFRKCFPGTVHSIYIINMNRVFSPVLKLVKPFIVGPCLDLYVYGANDHSWKDKILEQYDPRQIRPVFGGTKSG